MTAQALVAPVAEDIARMSDRAERERRLPDELMGALKSNGLFSLYAPKRVSGLELPLPEALETVEEVARHDGSTGWVVALGVGNDVFTCSLDDDGFGRVFANGPVLLAGSPGLNVRAERIDGGYRITGQWQYASGAPNADWCNVAAPIFENGAPRMGSFGMPEMVLAFMHPGDVEIVDTWHVAGMRATGSHDLRADGVFVPEALTGSFSLAGPVPKQPSILARIPFMTLLGMVQAPPVCLGVARHAIEEFRTLALEKERPPSPRLAEQPEAQQAIGKAEALVRSARAYFYSAANEAWDTAAADQPFSFESRANIRLACLTAAENSVAAVDLLWRMAGSTAIFESSPLERCWRDVHTAAQHVQVQDGRWATAGRILLGLDPAHVMV